MGLSSFFRQRSGKTFPEGQPAPDPAFVRTRSTAILNELIPDVLPDHHWICEGPSADIARATFRLVAKNRDDRGIQDDIYKALCGAFEKGGIPTSEMASRNPAPADYATAMHLHRGTSTNGDNHPQIDCIDLAYLEQCKDAIQSALRKDPVLNGAAGLRDAYQRGLQNLTMNT